MAKGSTGGRSAGVGAGNAGIGRVVLTGGGGGNVLPGLQTLINRAQQAYNNTNQTQDWADMTDVAATMLRRMLGQTGDEAGLNRRFQGDSRTTYVQTSKSYLVNNALNNDMKSLDGYVPNGAKHWLNTGYNINDAKTTVKSIDSGMKPLVSDTKLVRYEGAGDNGRFALEQMTGVKGLTVSAVAGMSQAQLDKMFVGRSATSKAYLSASWRMDRTSSRDRQYMSMPIRKEYLASTGTHAVVTNNVGEHEVVVGRGYDQVCVGARMEKGQLVLSMVLDPKHRSGYYNIK